MTRSSPRPSPELVAQFEGDPICRVFMCRWVRRLLRKPRFRGWSADEIRAAIYALLLDRLARFDRRRGHIRAFAKCIVNSAALELYRIQGQKRLVEARRVLSLHEPDRSGQTPADRLRVGAARTHVDAVIDQTTVGEVMARLSPDRRRLCVLLSKHGIRGARKPSGLSKRDFTRHVANLREAFETAGYDLEAATKSRSRRALSARDERTYIGMGHSRPR